MDVREWLKENSEEEYRNFTGRLMQSRYPLLGVRLPLLRKKASQLVAEQGEKAIEMLDDSSFEMIMLEGFVIAAEKKPLAEKEEAIYRHLLKCDNWSLIDSFASCFKSRSKEREELYRFLSSLKQDEHEYVRRFVLVAMQKFLDDEHIDDIMTYLRQLGSEAYCVEMAAGWLLASAYINYPEKVLDITDDLSESTYRYARGKINDSYRISEEKKKEYREAGNGNKNK